MDMDKMALIPHDEDKGQTGTRLNFSRHGAFTPEEFLNDLRAKNPELRDALDWFIDRGRRT